MENLRQFLLRLFQVVWLCSAVFLIVDTIDRHFGVETLAIIAIWSSILVIVQYLIFSSINPVSLFDGYLSKGSRNKQMTKRLCLAFIFLPLVCILIQIIKTEDDTTSYVTYESLQPELQQQHQFELSEAEPKVFELRYSQVDAYNNGTMDELARAELEHDLKAGLIKLPPGAKLKARKPKVFELRYSQVDAYNNGTMDELARAELEHDLKAGLIKLPPGAKLVKRIEK